MVQLIIDKKRDLSLDFIRIVACFFVIIRHVADNGIQYTQNSHYEWKIAILYNSLSYIGIPIFLMITGYLMLGRNESYGVLFKKRIPRLLLPLLGWSIIYYLFIKKYINPNVDHNFVKFFFREQIFYHLWYVYFIIAIYLAMPIVRKTVKQMNNIDFIYTLILWAIFSTILPIIDRNFGYKLNPVMTYIFTGFWGYIILGFYLSRLKITVNIFRYSFITLFIGCSSTFIGTLYYSNKISSFYTAFLDLFSMSIIATSISFFLFIQYIVQHLIFYMPTKISRIIVTFSNMTFSIFLVHALVLDAIMRGLFGLKMRANSIDPIMGIPLLAIIVLIICTIIVLILSRIPIIKNILVV